VRCGFVWCGAGGVPLEACLRGVGVIWTDQIGFLSDGMSSLRIGLRIFQCGFERVVDCEG
jgi:hypothetical protein